jgi:uncharacterized membrane protein
MNIKNFLTKEQQDQITQAIAEAEKKTSGEIRIHLEKKCKNVPEKRAIMIFNQLKMYATAQRNGSLIYIAVEDRKFAVIGDKGINEIVPENFWDSIRDQMLASFSTNDYTSGIVQGINAIGEKLKQHFPYQSNDTNELTDEISFNND